MGHHGGGAVFDEMLDWRGEGVPAIQAGQDLPAGAVRPHYRQFADWLARQSEATMANKRAEADLIFRRVGITFAVYGDKDETNSGTERTIPFDVIPRIFPASVGGAGARVAPARGGAEPLHP